VYRPRFVTRRSSFDVPLSAPRMLPPPTAATLEALDRIPNGQYLLTTAFGDILDGRIVDRVQQCGTTPPMLLVAMEKGHVLSPLIRDSRTFALSLLDPNERLVQRVFGPDRRIGENPFLTYPFTPGTMGAPIVTRATAWFDCEVVRHLDMETNYELYIGVVHAAGLGTAPLPRLNAALHAARRADAPGADRRLPRLRASAEPTTAESPADRLRGKVGVGAPAGPALANASKKPATAPAPRRRTGR
jgi:flavin reductase (DIM6/NTAB) family NADH-FMN oxidoreductase RutF